MLVPGSPSPMLSTRGPRHIGVAPALWLSADRGCFTTHDGSTRCQANDAAVGRWEDFSGNGRHYTQASAGNRPTFQLNVVRGRPAVRFDGANDFLSGVDLSSLTAAEMFIVLKSANDPPGGPAQGGFWTFGSQDGAGSGASRSTHPYSDGNIYDSFGTTSRKSTGNPTPSLAAWHLYNVISVAGEWTSNINGTQHYTTGSNTVGFRTNTAIGVSGESGLANLGSFFDGDVAEIALYPAKLSAGQRTIINNYVALRYGITVAA